MTVRVTLPLPPRILSPNARSHYQAKARATKLYRTRAKIEFMASQPAGFRPRSAVATVQAKWFAKKRPYPDPDNAGASLKAAYDGLTDAGLFCNDRGLTHKPMQFEVSKDSPRIELAIEI